MKPRKRRVSGLNLIELQITIAILAILLVIVALVLYGPSWSALEMIIGVPLAFLAFATALSIVIGGYFKILEVRAALRVRRVMKLSREGSPEAERLARELPYGWGTDLRLSKHRDELVSLLSAPASRFPALQLLIKSEDRNPPDADAALLAGAEAWPDDLLLGIWRLTRSESTRLAIAPVFLRRATEATRVRLLAEMFSPYSLSRVPDPSKDWLQALAPFSADVVALPKHVRLQGGLGIDEARVAAYAAAFEPAGGAGSSRPS